MSDTERIESVLLDFIALYLADREHIADEYTAAERQRLNEATEINRAALHGESSYYV